MEPLKLTFPSLQSGQKFIIDTDPTATESWLRELAYVETDHTLNELTRVTQSLNRCHQKTAHREQNLYLLSKGYLALSRHIREQHDRHKVLVEKEQYKALHQLSTEMACGFKRLVSELSEQSLLLKKGRLCNAINHALHYLGIMLIEQYQLYSPISDSIWREMNILYGYSEANNLHTRKLSKAELEPLAPSINIEQTYIRNCLMSTIDPYHVEDSQHWHLFKYLSHWSHTCELSKDLRRYAKQCCFVIDLNQSNAPYIATENELDSNKASIRLLLTSKLIHQVSSQVKVAQSTGKLPSEKGFYEGLEFNNGKELLSRINAFCKEYLVRKSKRYPLFTETDTVWGLSAIRKVCVREKSLNKRLAKGHGLSVVLTENYNTEIQWQTKNHSEDGICLKNNKQRVEELCVGELVITKQYIDGNPQKKWQLGIVRWLKGNEQVGTTVGIEYIHGEIEFINYLTRNKTGLTIEHQVLLVKPYDNSHPMLITTKNLLGGHQNIQLMLGSEKVQETRVVDLVESNSNISIVRVRFQKQNA